ncbi:MAG: GntR family transcriptional regulator [Aeoliella sp.]
MPTLSRRAYTHLHAQIVTGQLRAGVLVSESGIAKQLGMSRTPVGEAIRRLAVEGLVEQVPRCGTIVRGIDRRDLSELFEMREALECYAAAKAAARITRTDLAKLQSLCDRMLQLVDQMHQAGDDELKAEKLQTFLSTDMAFHVLILRACGNQRIGRAVAQTRAVSSIFRLRRQKHDQQIVSKAHHEHQAILDALSMGDGAKAQSLMSAHIAASESQTLSQMELHDWRSEENNPWAVDLPEPIVEEMERLEREMP